MVCITSVLWHHCYHPIIVTSLSTLSLQCNRNVYTIPPLYITVCIIHLLWHHFVHYPHALGRPYVCIKTISEMTELVAVGDSHFFSAMIVIQSSDHGADILWILLFSHSIGEHYDHSALGAPPCDGHIHTNTLDHVRLHHCSNSSIDFLMEINISFWIIERI